MKRLRLMTVAVAAIAISAGDTANAGWGSFGSYGSSGGSSGGSYGSYRASFGSSGASYGGYRASYGSSGYGSSGYSAAYSSSGGSSGYSRVSVGYSSASYGSSGASSGSSGQRVGLLQHLKQKIQRHMAARASSGGSSGSHGGSSGGYTAYRSYGSYGGSSGGYSAAHSSHGSSGGSAVSAYRAPTYGSSGSASISYSPAYSTSYSVEHHSSPASSHGTVIHSAPVYSQPHTETMHAEPTPAAPVYSAPAAVEGSSQEGGSLIEGASYHQTRVEVGSGEAMITLSVPERSEVFVNGSKTRSTGTERQFVSRGLKPGFAYSYSVEIKNEINGRMVTESKMVRLRSGDVKSLVYQAPADSQEMLAKPQPAAVPQDVVTTLTVNVPDDAKVVLAGNVTAASGALRSYRTSQLKQGDVWNDYVVAVSVTRNGQTLTKQQTIALVAGSSPELSFDFDESSIAMR